ncbi:hypothetical protein M2168_002135 [Streptomyces sp. CZ24]|nr:hypothetical protein [Streptomyces sp. CZ24]MDH6189103.1 hypothetical protein [Streptomyces sp. CZ24]
MTGPTGELPPVEALSELQLRGSACVWCTAPLSCAAGVDLGARPYPDVPHIWWFPRACAGSCPAVAAPALAPEGAS